MVHVAEILTIGKFPACKTLQTDDGSFQLICFSDHSVEDGMTRVLVDGMFCLKLPV